MPKFSENPPSERQSLALIEDCGNPKRSFQLFRTENLEGAGTAQRLRRFGSAHKANADILSAVAAARCRRTRKIGCRKIGLQLLTGSANIGVRFWRLTRAGSAFRDSRA